MGVLEQVSQMRNSGVPEQEIVNRLRQQNVSPREINDALNQAQIKSAVSDVRGSDNLQPSVMRQESSSYGQAPSNIPPTDSYVPQQQGDFSSQDYYPPQTQQDYYPQQDYYQEGGYDNYSPEEGSSADTMIEIAEQVFSEKIKKIQKQLEEINEFKTLTQTKLDNSVDRLKKIEATMDKLQAAILDKVGSYGKNLDSIKKEMSMMQDSFRKVASAPPTHPRHTIHRSKKETTVVHKSGKKRSSKKSGKKKTSKKK